MKENYRDITSMCRDEFGAYWRSLSIILALMLAKGALDAMLALALVPLLGGVLGQSSAAVPGIWKSGMTSLQTAFGFETELSFAIVLIAVLAAVKCIITIVYYYYYYWAMQGYIRDRRTGLFRSLVNVKWRYCIDQRLGNSINAVFHETTNSCQFLMNFMMLLEGLITVAFYTAAATLLSPLCTLVTVAAFGALGVVILPLTRRARFYGATLLDTNQNLLHLLNELLSALKIVKGSRMEAVADELIGEQVERVRRYSIRVGVLKFVPGTILEPVIVLGVIGFIYAMQTFALVPVSHAAVIGFALYRSFSRVPGIQRCWIHFYQGLPSVQLINSMPKLLHENREIYTDRAPQTFQSLTFRDLTFDYDSGRHALEGLDLTIQRGEFVGIVGSSGAGKTTFVDMVLGFLEPTKGAIEVNGTALQEFDPRHWRDLLGYVPQETILFNETIFNNIALYRDGITLEDAQWAAGISDAEDFVRALSDGFSTSVGDRGAKLSGGQRQRLAFARAIVHKPQILLLDEATSSLDSMSEKKIQEAVESLRGQMTILVVAHRLSTVMNADRVIVLDKGRLLEQGKPSELIASSGRFQEMYALQTTQG